MSTDNDEINFLDGLEADPPPRPSSRPARAVASPRAPSSSTLLVVPRLLEFAGIALITAALTAGLVVWRLGPRDVPPRPGTNAVALGRTFVPKLAKALADGFEAGAEAIKAGKSLGDGNILIKAKFHESRAKAFDDHAGGAIHALVPDGQELQDESQRRAMVELFEGFAKGLREAR